MVQATERRPLTEELIIAGRTLDECRVKLSQLRGECEELHHPPAGDSLTQLTHYCQWQSREILDRVEALERELGRVL